MEEVEKAIKDLLDIRESLTYENWLGVNIHNRIQLKGRKIFNMLRLTALKQLPRLRKQPKPPELLSVVLSVVQNNRTSVGEAYIYG